METWLLKHRRLSLCFFITFISTAFGEVLYLHALRNSSIEFSCVPPGVQTPFGFALRREWIQKKEVLYHNFAAQAYVKDHTLEGRIEDRVVDRNQAVNVSITGLQGYDTDLYVCTFHYNTHGAIQNHSGRNKFMLYVKDYEPCSCPSYTLLLLSLSAGAGMLFITLLIIAAVHCMKPSRRGQLKSQHSVPIYEEMNGVREKPVLGLQEEDISSLYVKPRKENPYIN
ncbi:cd7 antigen-like isoform X2 [Hemibagrus wyckioides]|uniref:cd7 antigen-like isoform X2 n=1 Tax=Hemibagrus wyckioides TaxID=337641 RepID=UPI00266DA47B|nr:cd7 antigen-like isoform X2 [Hemibagrus wyckioides]